MTKKIAIFDPSILNDEMRPSLNLGDEIILEAVCREIRLIFTDCHIKRISTHCRINRNNLKFLHECNHVFVGGSNLLGNNKFVWQRLKWWRQWKLNLREARKIRGAILFGPAWRQYEDKVGLYTRSLYRMALSIEDSLHSVRDGYTAKKLKEIGFSNVINTCCPTVWPLANKTAADFPRNKAKTVLFMVSDYLKHAEHDRNMIKLLQANYETMYLWPQGPGDVEYVINLGATPIIVPPTLKSLGDFLKDKDCDYVGTRLHGGIRCLLAGKRSLIICIDNRAAEIALDINLPTAQRGDADAISTWVTGPTLTELNIDTDAINRWRNQFSEAK